MSSAFGNQVKRSLPITDAHHVDNLDIRLADSIDFDKEVVSYGENGKITISFDR